MDHSISAEAAKKKVKTFLIIGFCLFLLTGFTVLLATAPSLDVGQHGFDKWDALLGLAVAAFKSTLVALIFMHLNHEKKAVYWIFCGSFIFVLVLAALTLWAKNDPLHDPYFYKGRPAAATTQP